MTKHVLDVGNCAPDHTAICRLIEGNFDAVVTQAHLADDSLAALRDRAYDLVLINRKLDHDYSDGVDVLRQILADPKLATLPVMLVSNYEDHQQLAIQAGAVGGFGKLAMGDPQTLERLSEFLT